jgi:hypothetical protein
MAFAKYLPPRYGEGIARYRTAVAEGCIFDKILSDGERGRQECKEADCGYTHGEGGEAERSSDQRLRSIIRLRCEIFRISAGKRQATKVALKVVMSSCSRSRRPP